MEAFPAEWALDMCTVMSSPDSAACTGQLCAASALLQEQGVVDVTSWFLTPNQEPGLLVPLAVSDSAEDVLALESLSD